MIEDDAAFTLIVDTPRGFMIRRVLAASPLRADLRQGTAAEEATHEAAAVWGLPDFVFRPRLAPVASGVRELGDGIVLVGPYGLVIQVKSREGDLGNEEKERRWISKKSGDGLRQAEGTVRRLALSDVELTNLRGSSISVTAGEYRWLTVVIIDHPSPPMGITPDLSKAKQPAVVMLRRDWEFLFDQLKSTYAVAQYLERVAGEEHELGLESARYYDLAQEDAVASPDDFPEALLAGGTVLSAPLLPLAPAGTEDREAHLILRTLLEDIAVTRLQTASEVDRLRILAELDRLPVAQRAVVGRRVLAAMEHSKDDAAQPGLVWRMSSVRGFGGRVHLGVGTCSQPYTSPNVADGLRLWTQLRHHDVLRAAEVADELTTVAVLVTPRNDGVRPWDTSVAAVSGPVSFDSSDLKVLRELFPGSQ